MTGTPWLDIAWSEMGHREKAGETANPVILAYFTDAGHPEVTSDEVAWCAAFVAACLERAGRPSTRSLRARSYETYGTPLGTPRRGAIAVLRRTGNGALGHVGFVERWDEEHIYLLGGNQQDQVTVQAFPRMQVITYRWPPGEAVPGPQPAPASKAPPKAAPKAPAPKARKPGIWARARIWLLTKDGKPPQSLASADSGVMPASYTVEESGGAVARTALKSRTIFGALLAFLGAVLSWLQHGAEMAIAAAGEVMRLEPVKALLIGAAGNLKSISIGVVVFGVVLTISRRLIDESNK
jgi:uncharacterized protein (TIGR02594 family)